MGKEPVVAEEVVRTNNGLKPWVKWTIFGASVLLSAGATLVVYFVKRNKAQKEAATEEAASDEKHETA